MMESLQSVLDSIIKNREWLFSGVGLSVITLIIFIYKKIRNHGKDHTKPNHTSYNITYLEATKNENIIEEGSNPLYDLVERFKLVYVSHGIAVNQISVFVDSGFNLKLSDFRDNDSILNILNEELLQWTCDTFGINRDWIDGTSDRIYRPRNFYKDVTGFIKLIVGLKEKHGDDVEVYFLKNGKLDPDEYGKHYVVIIIRSIIKNINNKPVYMNIPISTNWDWGYWRSRYQLKSIIYFVQKLDIYFQGYDIDTITQNNLSSGQIYPEVELNKFQIGHTWYPEDFIDLPSQSVQAKETDETKKVREYIRLEGYEKYFKQIISVEKEHLETQKMPQP
ncbi:hypothetical protein C4A75_00545 [Brevibacillus laterosporus]|uniref:Uncharacterized protein n=1 Tax=Brevibacillus laterosporus TaxID=1465 RepID=A0AAP8QFP2_BRELA|nr:hypothetical protein [Brevibacillus laterosporus]PPA87734.1 hypothetical protein C4A75_00545 [Brevibacillus laterosporus]PPB08863.1 hypothetical protein C4A77_06140 [Brevibacillus laterosporus]